MLQSASVVDMAPSTSVLPQSRKSNLSKWTWNWEENTYSTHLWWIMKALVKEKWHRTLGYVPANSVPATVKFCWTQVLIQFSIVKLLGLLAPMAVVKMRPWALSLDLNQNRYFHLVKWEHLHPARIVSPARWKTTENRENSCSHTTGNSQSTSYERRWLHRENTQ